MRCPVMLKTAAVLAVLFVVTASGCRGPFAADRTEDEETPQRRGATFAEDISPADYFPTAPGSYWRYQGTGNEFASFTREVLFEVGSRAQFREDNGGTVSAAVYEITNDAVTRVFFAGEMYGDDNVLNRPPNDATVILRAPLKEGTKWGSKGAVREITGLKKPVETPAGTFENCIEVTISSENSTVYEYYARNIGLVKRQFASGGYQVTSSLEAYDIK